MSTSEIINYEGIVKEHDSEHVTVHITSEQACTECHSQGVCSLSENKIIDIAGNYNLKDGDCVTVQMKQSTGYSAVVLGYLIPFVVVIATLIILNVLNVKESHAGIIALLSVFVYYFCLLLYKKKISRKFEVSLKT